MSLLMPRNLVYSRLQRPVFMSLLGGLAAKCYFHLFNFQKKTVLINFILIVYETVGFFQIIFLELRSKFEMLFAFLSFSKTLQFCSFIIFTRTHRTGIPSNYIYFIKNKPMNGLLLIL